MMRKSFLAASAIVLGLSVMPAVGMPLASAPQGVSNVTLAAACGYGLYRGIDGNCHRSAYVHTKAHPGKNTHCFWHRGAQVCH